MNVNFAQHFNPFYATDLFFIPWKHKKIVFMFSESIKKERKHDAVKFDDDIQTEYTLIM